MTLRARVWATALLATLGGCTSTGVNEAAVSAGMHAEATRGALMEATLRVMDEHPAYVDEFFARSRAHTPTLDRFLYNASQQMDDPALADMTARRNVENPAGVRALVSRTLVHARNNRAALDAVAAGMTEQSEIASDAVAPHPTTIRRLFRGLTVRAARNPVTRAGLLAAIRDNRQAVTRMIVNDPATRRAMAEATAQQAGGAVEDSARSAVRRFVHGGDGQGQSGQGQSGQGPSVQRGGGPR